jgi:hypothetical protein
VAGGEPGDAERVKPVNTGMVENLQKSRKIAFDSELGAHFVMICAK